MSDSLNKKLSERIVEFNREALNETKQNKMVTTVTSPSMLTIIRKGGKAAYAKHAFLGDEKLVFVRIYYGKKNTPIVVFEPKASNSEYTAVEIPFDKIGSTDFASEYDRFVHQLGFGSFEEMFREYHADCIEVAKEEEVADGVGRYGENWGGWA